MSPPYKLNSEIVTYVSQISEKLGKIQAAHLHKSSPKLRQKNRIRTIQSTLAIEGNTLSEDQITAIFENKRVLGPKKDIQEVKNAIEAYSRLTEFNPYTHESFLQAHAILMTGLIQQKGKYRSEQVGIMRGNVIAHLPPPSIRVYPLMGDLFTFVKEAGELMLIKSCVFHYEMEFIHPFMDGNGRMGRLWQTLLLMQVNPVFEYLPLESLIKEKQEEYYEALSRSDKSGSSTIFITYMLHIIHEALTVLLNHPFPRLDGAGRMEVYREIIGKKEFSRKDYMAHFKEISTSTASRDLIQAVEKGILRRKGEKRLTKYQFLET
ncbi:MAG: Fic family protein [Bacteroidota bacterium]